MLANHPLSGKARICHHRRRIPPWPPLARENLAEAVPAAAHGVDVPARGRRGTTSPCQASSPAPGLCAYDVGRRCTSRGTRPVRILHGPVETDPCAQALVVVSLSSERQLPVAVPCPSAVLGVIREGALSVSSEAQKNGRPGDTAADCMEMREEDAAGTPTQKRLARPHRSRRWSCAAPRTVIGLFSSDFVIPMAP